MTLLIEDLLQTLEKQNALYDQVLALMEQERAALVSHQPQDVLLLVRRKETLLLKIRTLDESRQIIRARLARDWNIPAAEINLSRIESLCEDAALRQRISDLRYQMTESLGHIRAACEENARLCRQGLQTIHTILQDVCAGPQQHAGPGAQSYGRGRYPAAGPRNNTMHWTT